MRELTIPALLENLPEVTAFVDGLLAELECPLNTQYEIDVAVDELFTNISSYAYAPETGSATIQIEVFEDPRSVAITFIDSGVPYDPLAKPDPDITLSAEERQIGGLGIYMVKQSMDEVTYDYKDGQNILNIRKCI